MRSLDRAEIATRPRVVGAGRARKTLVRVEDGRDCIEGSRPIIDPPCRARTKRSAAGIPLLAALRVSCVCAFSAVRIDPYAGSCARPGARLHRVLAGLWARGDLSVHDAPCGSTPLPSPARTVVWIVIVDQPLGSIMPPRPFGSISPPSPARIVVFAVIEVSWFRLSPCGAGQPLGSSWPPLPARRVVLLVIVRSRAQGRGAPSGSIWLPSPARRIVRVGIVRSRVRVDGARGQGRGTPLGSSWLPSPARMVVRMVIVASPSGVGAATVRVQAAAVGGAAVRGRAHRACSRAQGLPCGSKPFPSPARTRVLVLIDMLSRPWASGVAVRVDSAAFAGADAGRGVHRSPRV
jgi:hypothetical protein